MDYVVHAPKVEPQTTAVVRRRARPAELSKVVPQACGEVWTFLRAAGVPNPGRHVAVYFDDEINLEVGAEVGQPFAGDGNVVCSATPGGLVATTTHFGPYNRLGEAYEAIKRWCKENGRAPIRPCWEVYGHWTDDVTKLQTDVFFLLQANG
jgi:effector-binding domain-containing protein